MKNAVKKVLSIMLVAVMLFGVAPLNGFAGIEFPASSLLSTKADTLSLSGACGKNLIWTLDKSSGVLNINGIGAMDNYSSVAPWFNDRLSIKTVVIETGVTNIGDRAFNGCNNLENISIPNTVISIGESAFYGCKITGDITVPDNVKYIGEKAFCCCYDITSIIIPDSVEHIGESAFLSCINLSNVKLSNRLTSIENNTFRDCRSLESIIIPDGVTSVGDEAFRSCDKLTNVIIPESVTSIGSAFEECPELAYIDLHNGITDISGSAFDRTALYGNPNNWIDDVFYLNSYLICAKRNPLRDSYTIRDGTKIIASNAFSYCDNLKTITIPGCVEVIGSSAFRHCENLYEIIVTDGVKEIGDNAFHECTKLYEITIPGSVSVIGEHAFEGCKKLSKVVVKDGVKSIGWQAFYECNKLSDIKIADSVEYIGENVFERTAFIENTNNWENGNVLYIDNHLIKIKSGSSSDGSIYAVKDGTISIAHSAFKDCGNLRIVEIPDSVKSIGNSAFNGCSDLYRVDIPNSVTYIGESAFSGCSSLTNVTIPNSVTTIGNFAFSRCSDLVYINIPNSITTIGGSTFSGCSSLTNVNIPSSVTTIGEYVFYDCYSLTDIYIPDKVVEIGERAFEGCSHLEKIEVDSSNPNYSSCDGVWFNKTKTTLIQYPLGNTRTSYIIPDSVKVIADSAFGSCINLTSITIGKNVTSIGNTAFSGCKNLCSVSFDGNNSLQSIGNSAFVQCESLVSILTPESLAEIGENVFAYCKSLRVAIINGEMRVLSGTFNECTELKQVSIPDSVVEIGDQAFRFTKIDKIKLSANLRVIGFQAFFSCDSLNSIELPSTVKSIGISAFAFCRRLSYVKIPNQTKEILKDAFDLCDALERIDFVGSKEEFESINCFEDYPDAIVSYLSEYQIKAYSPTSNKTIIAPGKEMVLMYSLFEYENTVSSGVNYSITVSDDSVISIKEAVIPDVDGNILPERMIIVKGLKTGTATISIEEKNTGEKYCVTIHVYDYANEPLTFSINNIPEPNGDANKTIFETSGLYINNLSKEETENGEYKVSFDVYNTSNLYGSVDIYDKSGTLVDYEIIDRYAVFGDVVELGSYIFYELTGDADDYTDKRNSVKTYIEITVPEGGYFVIGNNICLSKPAYVYNVVEIAFCVFDIAMNEENIKKLIKNIPEDEFQYLFKKTSEVTAKGIITDIEGIKSFFESFMEVFLGVVKDSLEPENVIVESINKIPSIGEYLETAFIITEFLDISGLFISVIFTSPNADVISVFTPLLTTTTNVTGISAEWDGTAFGDETNIVLHTYKLQNSFSGENGHPYCSDSVVYNICFFDGTEEVQPNNPVKISIPIPSDWDYNQGISVKHKSDQGWENIEISEISNGYITFYTKEFSLYSIVLNETNDSSYSVELSFEQEFVEVNFGEIINFNLSIEPSDFNSKNIVWSSNDNDVAYVLGNGSVLSIKPGTAMITAQTLDGKYSATCTVKVKSIEADAVFDANGGAWSDGATEKTISVKFGEEITAPEAPKKQGYVFSRWTPEIDVMDSTDGKAFTAEWIPATDTRYTVETYTMNTEGEYEKSSQVFSGTTDSTVSVEAKEKIGFAFNSENSVTEGVVKADNSLVLKVYYDRNKYVFTTVTDGVSSTENYYYGATIIAPESPEKQGYKFIKWEGEIPETMPAESVTITAVFEKSYICPDCGKEILGEAAINEHVAAEARMKATVEIKNNNGSNTIKYGETLRLTAITNDMPADVIVCWYVNGEKKGEGETFELSLESGTKTVEVKLVDTKGNVLKNASGNEIKDTETVTVKAGFFQKLIAFFKKLFGISQTVVQSIYF